MMDLLKHCRISIAGKKYRIFAKSLTVIYRMHRSGRTGAGISADPDFQREDVDINILLNTHKRNQALAVIAGVFVD
jgi:hypothetical protein